MNNMIYSRIFWILFSKSFKKQINKKYDSAFAKNTMKRAKKCYFDILINAPTVGKNNPKLTDILFTAFVAAIYKSGEGKISPEQMYPIMTKSMESVFVFRKSFNKNDHFNEKWQNKRNLQAVHSQKRVYPGDFVCDFIYGKTFDEYGINYYECAIYKLLIHEKCPELTPLFCKFDYFMANHMNATLKRTNTLATGGDYCDFWYTKMK